MRVLADVGAYGANLHDNDLVPIDATPAERDRIAAAFKRALHEKGIVVPTAPTMASFFGAYSREKANKLKAFAFDRVGLGNRGMQYERLDQLVFDLLMGVR